MNNQLHNQIKQLSDRELLEGIYQMLLVVMQEQLISDSKQLGINVIADLLVDNMYRNRERNENNNNAPYIRQSSTSFVITRFATLNDTVKCYIPDQTKNFPGMKVEVKGIVDGQELYWGYSANVKLVNITQDGIYDIPPLETVNGNLSFRNGNIVGACNITITQLPLRQQ